MKKQDCEANMGLIRELFDGMLQPAQLEHWGRYFAPIVLLHGPTSGSTQELNLTTGREFNRRMTDVFEKTEIDIQQLFAHDDKVVICWTLHGTHKLDTKNVVVSGTSVYRIDKGKIVEIWQSWDRLGMLEQLGEVRVCSSLVDLENTYDTLKKFGMERYGQLASILSKREKQCLHCLLRGQTAKSTAKMLKLSPRTVEYYFEICKGKLGCANKQELFATAQQLNNLELL